jgi:hypothetical protein
MKLVSLAACVVVLAVVPSSGAQTTATRTPSAGAPAATPTRSRPPVGSTSLRANGTITKYDADGGQLALSTEGGLMRFDVRPSARVRHRGRAVEAKELVSLAGHRAAVRYWEADGQRTVESVNVFDNSERNPR